MFTMYPCVVRPVLEEVVEPALKKSFVLLAEAGHSPQELIDRPGLGGGPAGRTGASVAAASAGTHKRRMRALRPLSSRSTRHYVTPCRTAGHAPSPRWQAGEETVPMLQHFAQHYNDISQRRGDVARIYAVRAQDKEFGLCHTYELGRFCRPSPCCRRRSASRLLATSSRSRAPLQSRNRACSLLSGPTKRGSRAWRGGGVRGG